MPGVRKAFTIFANLTADERFNTSIVLLETYGIQAVRSVPVDSTALPREEREHPVLATPVLFWEGSEAQTVKDAYAYAGAIRDALFAGVDGRREKRHCYVNYANGEEGRREMYGYDGRVERLGALKEVWDPKNRFGWYNPVV